MKRMILLIIGGCFISQLSLYGQNIENVLTMKEQIKKYEQSITLEESLRLLEKKYDVTFIYKSSLVEDKVIPKKIVEAKDFQTALTNLGIITNLKYEQVGNRNFLLSSAQADVKPTETVVQETITGTVIDARSGETLPGVNVMVKETTIGTSTDNEGRFELTVESLQDTLVFSFVGYRTVEAPINGQSVIDIEMEYQMVDGEELIVVGYGSVERSDVTGSVQRISGETFESQGITQVSEMLVGTVAGFNANQSTDAAGGSSMEIRGRNSLNAGTSPMIVVDGNIFNGSMRDINPNDIESIDVLKDASSAAIYGSRAASGVIQITTKRGTEGKPTIDFTTRIGRTDVRNDSYAPRDGDEYIQFRQDYYRNQLDSFPYEYYSNPNNLPGGVTIDEWRNLSSGTPNEDNMTEWMNRMNFYAVEQEGYLEGREIDWFGETMPGGMQQEADVSISGGTDVANYYWSIGYIDNEGMVAGDEFSALRTRLNLDFQITDWLSAGTRMQYSDRDESSVTASLSNMYEVSPFGRMYSEDGSLEWYPGEQRTATNPLINTLGQDRSRKLANLFGDIFVEVALPYGITHEVSFQPRISRTRELNYWSPETITGGDSYAGGRATRETDELFEWMLENMLKWSGDYGAHSFDVTLLHSAEETRTWYNGLSNNTFQPSPNLGYSGLNYGTNPAFDVEDTKVTGDAMMARLNYGLMDRYLITASIRRDGYSAFGQENPRATFPALAFAWKINEESFFNVDLVEELKLRLSWGVNGNRDIGAYSSLAQLGSNRYSNGSEIVMGVYTNSLSNSGLMWEETESYNVGLDMAFLENRINLSLDYYDMTTSNLLVDRTLPISTGFTSITDNIGELANKGFEATLHTNNINASDFNWRSTLTFSLNRNEITQLFGDTGTYTLVGEEYEGELPDYTNEWFPGYAVDAIWNYERIGIWQEEEADAAAEYNQIPGDIKVRDLNDNQLYEEDYDKQFIGYTEPRYRIGLRNEVDFLGNFSASMFVRADLGHMAEFEGPGYGGSSTFERENLEPYPYWTLENRSNEYPSLHHNPNDFAGGLTFWKDASFVRIQDVTLSYSVPQVLSQRVQIQNVRIFGSVRNLATFSAWPGWDPESLNSPMPRTFSLGLNVSL